MSVDEIAAAARAQGAALAQALMADTFTAYAFTWTKVDGLDEQVWTQVGGPVMGKVPSRRSADPASISTVEIGGVERVVVKEGLHLEWEASPEDGIVYVHTGLGPESHPSMLGRAWHVVEPTIATNQTAWRLDVVEVPSPVEEA